MDSTGCLIAAAAYGFLGLFLSYVYYRAARLREAHQFQRLTLLVILLGASVTFLVTSRGPEELVLYRAGIEGYLFLGASVCHLPVLVYILLSHWSSLLERLTSPAIRQEKQAKERTPEEDWKLVARCREALLLDPLDAKRRYQLAEAYLRLERVDHAVGEFQRTIECLERGYEQAYLLFRTSRLLVERQADPGSALPLLRRTIRLYPKSYFAAYARRVVNQYEAHQAS